MPELTEPVFPQPEQNAPANQPEMPSFDQPAIPQTESPSQETLNNSQLDVDALWNTHGLNSRPTTGTSRRLPISVWLSALLVPYAIMATIGLVYILQQRARITTEPHILESIPDQGLYEEFLDGRRHEVIQPLAKAGEKPAQLKVIPPNEPLNQVLTPVTMGETRRIGLLEITPQSVLKQNIQYAWQGGKANVPAGDALVLKILVKNTGNVIFRPDDETFNRSYINEAKSPVYTYLEVGPDRFYGVVSDPSTERLSLPVCESLLPGETTTMHIVAMKNKEGKSITAISLKPGDECVWRVHLRRGKEEITLSTGKKRKVWLTTVVPVKVEASDIK